jgi:hypothetical protein
MTLFQYTFFAEQEQASRFTVGAQWSGALFECYNLTGNQPCSGNSASQPRVLCGAISGRISLAEVAAAYAFYCPDDWSTQPDGNRNEPACRDSGACYPCHCCKLLGAIFPSEKLYH